MMKSRIYENRAFVEKKNQCNCVVQCCVVTQHRKMKANSPNVALVYFVSNILICSALTHPNVSSLVGGFTIHYKETMVELTETCLNQDVINDKKNWYKIVQSDKKLTKNVWIGSNLSKVTKICQFHVNFMSFITSCFGHVLSIQPLLFL